MGLPQQVAGPSRGCRSDRQVKEKQRSVVVLGHSFITRLDQYVKTPGSDFNLDIFNINLIGVPGATVQRLRCHSQTYLLNNFEGTAVVLQIGGNDLNNNAVQPVQLATDIICLAR